MPSHRSHEDLAYEEVAQRFEVEVQWIEQCVECEWIVPADPEARRLDAEDVARLRLISDLTERMGVNEDAVPIILQLIDQVHELRSELRRFSHLTHQRPPRAL